MMTSILLLNFSTGRLRKNLSMRNIQFLGTDPDRQETSLIVNGGQYMTNGHITMCSPYINIRLMSRIIFQGKGTDFKSVPFPTDLKSVPGTGRAAVFYLTHSGVWSPAIDSLAPRAVPGQGPFVNQPRRQGKVGNDHPFNCFNSLF